MLSEHVIWTFCTLENYPLLRFERLPFFQHVRHDCCLLLWCLEDERHSGQVCGQPRWMAVIDTACLIGVWRARVVERVKEYALNHEFIVQCFAMESRWCVGGVLCIPHTNQSKGGRTVNSSGVHLSNRRVLEHSAFGNHVLGHRVCG